MELPRTLDELNAGIQRGEFFTSVESQRLLKDAERMQAIYRVEVKVKAKAWRARLCRLNMLVTEMRTTPGAEVLLAKAEAANAAIDALADALNQASNGEAAPKVEEAGGRATGCGHVLSKPNGSGEVGIVSPSGARWKWCRVSSKPGCGRRGIEDTLEQAKGMVEQESVDTSGKPDNTRACKLQARWVTICDIVGRVTETYQVPTGKRVDTENLGTVTRALKTTRAGNWNWSRYNSGVHDWKDGKGVADSMQDAKAKVLEGWNVVTATVEEATWHTTNGVRHVLCRAHGDGQIGDVTQDLGRWYWTRNNKGGTRTCGHEATLLQAKTRVLEGGMEPVEEVNATRAGWTASGAPGRELYHVPTGDGIAVEWLGVVAPDKDGRWEWCRHRSELRDWAVGSGIANSKKDARCKVLEGWGALAELIDEVSTMRCRSAAAWITPVAGRRVLGRRLLYKVPTGRGGIEWLGTVASSGGRWDWCRHSSKAHDWAGEQGGTVDTLKQAKDKVLDGWA
jgi:hypothetical protein